MGARSNGPPYYPETEDNQGAAIGSLQVAQVGKSLLENRLLLRGELELATVWTFEHHFRPVLAGRNERALQVGRGCIPRDRSTFDVVRDRQAKQVEDRRGGVDQVGFERSARGKPRAGQGDDSFGPMGARQVGVGLDPRSVAGQLGANPVRVVGQGDEVGISFAGRVEICRPRGGDDLGKSGLPVSGW